MTCLSFCPRYNVNYLTGDIEDLCLVLFFFLIVYRKCFQASSSVAFCYTRNSNAGGKKTGFVCMREISFRLLYSRPSLSGDHQAYMRSLKGPGPGPGDKPQLAHEMG
ncbi:hypothetical protein Dimus_010808 [Dionaea muscipula]